LWALEPKLKDRLRAVLQRGHVDVWMQVTAPTLERKSPLVDAVLAKQYKDAYLRLQRTLGLQGEVDMHWIASQPDVFRLESKALPLKQLEPLALRALGSALQKLQAMRRAEGKRLLVDIRRRVNAIQRIRKDIEQRVVINMRLQKAERHKTVLKAMRSETAADVKSSAGTLRNDVTEELVRLNSHVLQFGKFLNARQPVGRSLDFLIQEMNREINTIGSKSMDTQIAHRVVSVKEELEKIREQVQNLE
jgi:uncharacterized protein (TIGR00255 family)